VCVVPRRIQDPEQGRRRRAIVRGGGAAAFNVEKLAFFLLDPHPVMPNMSLSRNEAQDIAAYIARIRK
jgi:hypothetical protein